MIDLRLLLRKGKVKGHRIRWYGRVGDEWIPRTRFMPGKHWGWDVRCECGWESRTGGAIQEYVRKLIAEHLWNVENGWA